MSESSSESSSASSDVPSMAPLASFMRSSFASSTWLLISSLIPFLASLIRPLAVLARPLIAPLGFLTALARPLALLARPLIAPLAAFFNFPRKSSLRWAALAASMVFWSNLRLELDAALAVRNRLIWPERMANSTCFNDLALLRRKGIPINHFGARSLLLPSGKLR